jgi:hypothetical protein
MCIILLHAPPGLRIAEVAQNRMHMSAARLQCVGFQAAQAPARLQLCNSCHPHAHAFSISFLQGYSNQGNQGYNTTANQGMGNQGMGNQGYEQGRGQDYNTGSGMGNQGMTGQSGQGYNTGGGQVSMGPFVCASCRRPTT